MYRSKVLSNWKILLFLFLYFFGYLFLYQFFLQVYLVQLVGKQFYFVIDLLIQVLLAGVFVFIAAGYFGQQLSVFQQNRRENWKHIFLSISCLFMTNLLISECISFLLPDVKADNQVNNNVVMQINLLYYLISSSILAPFIEETVFRGCIFGKLREKHTFAFSACISAFLFGGLHILASLLIGNWTNCIWILVYALCGFVLCIPYEDTGSIFSSISTHALYNFLSILLMLWMK